MFAAIVLIVVGAVLLMSNLGYIRIANLADLLHTWWPLILVVAGISMFITRWRRGR
jgi:uncharacterized membrane protein YhhN